MLLDDIEAYLATFAPWTQSGKTYTVRKNFTPDQPDEVITLIEFPAGGALRAMGPSLTAPVRERAGLMVLVRGPLKDYANARAMAELVYQRLDHFAGTLSGRLYYIESMHVPILKEQDRNGRWLVETNFVAQKERG